MPHPSQMFYGNHSKFGKRSSSVQSLISRGLSLYMYMVRSQNVILHLWEGNFILFDKIPVSTIKLAQWRFQAFLGVSLFEKLIWKSRRPQDKTSIRGGSPGIPYKLRNKDAIGGWGWNIATQERKICYVEIEIVTFVINGSVKLTVLTDRQWQWQWIQVRSRSIALCRVFDFEFNGIHLAKVIHKLRVVYGQNIIDKNIKMTFIISIHDWLM